MNRQVESYNRAVVLANARDYRKAVAILEPLVDQVKDPKLAQDARALLKRLRQALAAGSER